MTRYKRLETALKAGIDADHLVSLHRVVFRRFPKLAMGTIAVTDIKL